MAATNRQSIYLVTALFLVFVFVLGVLHGCKREKSDQTGSGSPNSVASGTSTKGGSTDPIDAAASLFREPKASIQNIAKAAQTWNPSFEEWWGRPAPDFTLTDIEGKTHKLSDYRGKEVIVEIWTTWCPTCKLEVPHLKEVRGAFDQDNLAILAVSNETPDILKTFVTDQTINYTVLASTGSLPAPFGKAEFIPTTFFVDREGKFKLAGVGVVPVSDAKAIIHAQ
jgi:peroxiredoxin